MELDVCAAQSHAHCQTEYNLTLKNDARSILRVFGMAPWSILSSSGEAEVFR